MTALHSLSGLTFTFSEPFSSSIFLPFLPYQLLAFTPGCSPPLLLSPGPLPLPPFSLASPLPSPFSSAYSLLSLLPLLHGGFSGWISGMSLWSAPWLPPQETGRGHSLLITTGIWKRRRLCNRNWTFHLANAASGSGRWGRLESRSWGLV